ncbi:MAG: hypothetical protein ACFFCW_17275 [Candidatus Hodarchaeota archaeon]
MILIGQKFCTFLGVIEDELFIIKAQDVSVSNRKPIRCYREYLGYLIGTRLGLKVPKTHLLVHSVYGRISVQNFIYNARRIPLSLYHSLKTSTVGFKITLLDIICGNHDRRPDNVLELSGAVLPIDFNVAFGFNGENAFYAEANTIIMSWLGVDGILELHQEHRHRLQTEARTVQRLVDKQYLHYCLQKIEPCFLSSGEKERLFVRIWDRIDNLQGFLEEWWQQTVAPLFCLIRQGGQTWQKKASENRQTKHQKKSRLLCFNLS